MPLDDKRLDALIDEGWRAVQSHLSLENVKRWRKQAYQCVAMLLGEDHPYAEHFKASLKTIIVQRDSYVANLYSLTPERILVCRYLHQH